MKKTVFLILSVIMLIFCLIGCDPENGDEFTSSQNETIVNNVATLGLVGTSVTSNNTNVATVVITETAKIKITSIAEGVAEITVSNVSGHRAKINVIVSKTGIITTGSILKYNPFVKSWYSTIGSGVTLICEYSTWEIVIGTSVDKCGIKGNYIFSESNATFTMTHVKDISGNWTDQFPADTETYKPSIVYGITSLPQTFTGEISGSQLITTTGAGTFDAIP